MLLAASPLVGYYLGRWIDGRLHTEPWFSFVMLAIGFAAGVRETVLILRKVSKD
jgi:ATP synthase protein I